MAVNPINEVVRLKHNLQGAGYLKRGRPPKFSATQFYPRALENDLFDTLRAELDRLAELNTAAALQGIRDDLNEMNALQIELSAEFVNRSRQIGERIAENAGANFSKQVDMIIGRPYYPPGFQAPILNDWHEEFQTLCISAAQDGKKAIAATVAIAKEKGWNKGQLEAEIKKILPPETRHRAELIARTETGKLNSRCTLATYEEVGIKYYKWLTTMDGRERESHAELNGVICSVENPDVYYKENPENPLRPLEFARTGKMYHGHPGTDFQCRCSMVMWDPEIDGQFEVREDQRRAELERQEAEEKARQEEEERKAKEREAEEARKRQEAEEKARAEMEERARKEAEKKYMEEKAKAEAALKKAQEKAAKEASEAKKAKEKNVNIIASVEKSMKTEYKEYFAAEKAFKESYKGSVRFSKSAEITRADFILNKYSYSTEEMKEKARSFLEARKKLENAVKQADVVFRANGDISYTVAQYLKKTEKEYNEAALKVWENGDQRIKNLYLKIFNIEMKVSSAKAGYYSDIEKLVNLGKACRLTNKRGLSATLWHELGHNAHYSLGTPLYSRMNELRESAKKDLTPFYNLIDKLDREAIQNKALRFTYVKEKLFETEMFKDFFEVGEKLGGKDAVYSIFSDIAEGFSKGRVDMFSRGFYGHGKSYWRKNNPEEEFFAEMCEAYMRPEIKETLKKYIPNMVGIFEDFLNSL